MRIVDEIYLESPFYGSRRMVVELGRRGYDVGRKLVRRLMRLMGIEALYPHPKTTVSAPEHKKYPYLLRNLKVDHRNQVWEMDITYVPMRHGFMYLAAVIDVYSRRIMGWGLSNTMEAEWCAEIAAEAFERHGRPEIFNTDQGSQYTSGLWTEACGKEIKVSMDGRGRAKDNIWIERFWRTIKREYIYLNPCDNATELRKGIEWFMKYYNTERHHQGVDNEIPYRKYENNKNLIRTSNAA
ncbi:MAG: IS3 family transposase [Bacteroidales bacterium]|nr:IS3 family transposase [Bacteroidales bacterium]